MSDVKIINKEEIPSVSFVSYEVLNTPEQKAQRKEVLEKAMIIGNNDHGKAKIFFMTEDGMMEVETTVWATSDEVITLKGGVMIPVHSIEKVSFV